MVGASVAIRPISGETIGRFEAGKMVKAAAKTPGIMPPPMKPWMARHRIISLIELDVAQRMLATVKPAAAIEKKTRVESARLR